ncbi:MAG TPA: hypothetical protein VGV17_07500 [Bosea sp. (in: a-proteobacteria)]|jgi:hypothetical protein|uniref:hypothetical protein n=1 Tax=Bosea sp. (in: a-proteobacteria) TaxID=1871050 RepID=UPI002DDCB06D|nr:hypothetical protein [Bosea sp. (in: a-proteobacteria)]HEV2553584.1 hypothetical protein [Bosea sp. (in: a-proteobacteria)]
MKLAADDVARSLRASWQLMARGAEALDELELTRSGFWRSFVALLPLTLPAAIALLAALRLHVGLPNAAGLFTDTGLALAVLGATVSSILAVPALLLGLAPQLLHWSRFTTFVIAWNWAGIISVGLIAVPAAVFAIGWSTPGLALIQTLAFAVIVLRLRYCVARAAFGARSGLALPVLLASVVADYAILRICGVLVF